MKHWFLFYSLVGWLWLGFQAPVWAAKIRILNVSLSPRLLLELYQAWEKGKGITMFNPQIFLMNVKNEGAPAPDWTFEMVIKDGSNWVARVDFQASPLDSGLNQYNARNINGENSQVEFNRAYLPSTQLQNVLSGKIMPMRNYKVLFLPRSPNTGPPLVVNFALFMPQSALNRPPVPIFPCNVEVNTVLPTFTWTRVENASTYEVLVGQDSNLDVNTYWRSPKVKETQIIYSYAARALEDGQKYYWQIRAYNEFDQPVGGVHSQSQPAWFVVSTPTRGSQTVSPTEADSIVRSVLADPKILETLKNYQAIGIETTSEDLATLLRQLQAGNAKIISAELE